jgi:hypothetical protein
MRLLQRIATVLQKVERTMVLCKETFDLLTLPESGRKTSNFYSEELIPPTESQPSSRAVEDGKLLTESKDLCREHYSGLDQRTEK